MKLNKTNLSCAMLAMSSLAFSTAQAGPIQYSGPDISFEQLYQNPDDNSLKLNYARQQAAAGDFLGAAGALEGMLYSQPNWDSARLLYAIVLFELDDRVAAERELDILQTRPLSAEDQSTAARYRAALAAPSSRGLSFSGRVEAGLRVDDNAGNALNDTVLEVADESDVSAIVNGSAKVSVPLTQWGGLSFNASARGQTRNYFSFTNSDFGLIGADIGLSGDTKSLFWEAALKLDNVFIGSEKYLTQAGVGLSVGKMITDKTRVRVSAAAYDQDFESISFSFDERFRSGNRYDVTADFVTRVDEDLSYGASVGYEQKIATEESLAYDGFHIAGNVSKGFDNGLYVNGSARLRDLNYNAPSLIGGTATDRDDTQFAGRIGVGASLNKIGGLIGVEPNPALTNIFAETGVDYTDYNSSVSLFDYENIGADVKLIWNF